MVGILPNFLNLFLFYKNLSFAILVLLLYLTLALLFYSNVIGNSIRKAYIPRTYAAWNSLPYS